VSNSRLFADARLGTRGGDLDVWPAAPAMNHNFEHFERQDYNYKRLLLEWS
jgi:hypothetical protein